MSGRERISEQLSDFIRERFEVSANDKNFSADVHLWNDGYVDSLGVAEVIAFIEGQFSVKVPDDVFLDERNMTINGLASYTLRLTQEQKR